jgi:hypothetical protein
MDWFDLSQNKDRWWALVNAAKNFGIHEIWGICGLDEELLASQ